MGLIEKRKEIDIYKCDGLPECKAADSVPTGRDIEKWHSDTWSTRPWHILEDGKTICHECWQQKKYNIINNQNN